jgi:hypothetical protein
MLKSLSSRAGTLPGSLKRIPILVGVETLTDHRYEDLFAQDAETPSLVNVASKAYRRVALFEPGEYEATLSYNGTTETAYWDVKDLSEVRKTKNVLLYIGDGMTTNMITAARLIAHESKNGRYLSKMAMDKFPVVSWISKQTRFELSLTSLPARSPNDPLDRFVHHRLCQLRYCPLHWTQVHCQRPWSVRRHFCRSFRRPEVRDDS